MQTSYESKAVVFKALSSPIRLAILEMLFEGELCACEILAKFQITQPTLSHHMAILSDQDLVNWRKQGKWIYYSLNKEAFYGSQAFIQAITSQS